MSFQEHIKSLTFAKKKKKKMVRMLQINIETHLKGVPGGEHTGLGCLPRPWETFEEVLKEAAQHALPEITIPEEFPVDKNAILPDVYLSVFADPKVEVSINESLHDI